MSEVKDKKDVSVLVESQLPEFVSYEHPKFKTFVEKYYQFLESHQIVFDSITFNEYKLLPEDFIAIQEGVEFLAYEDGDRLQLESDRDTAVNANLSFQIGETITGNNSGATAVITGTKGNTVAFIKPTNNTVFQFGEQITGAKSRAYSTLANGVLSGTLPEASIESFRTRNPAAAIRELPEMQDIDTTNEGLIDDAWKKEFYTNIPRTTKTDRRQLLKRMKRVYRSKGNEESFTWLFRTLFAKEDVEFYYPKTDLMRFCDGRWTLDKTIKILSSSATNLELLTGRKIKGASSKCTAIVERAITSSVGALLVTELYLSDVVAGIDDDGILGFFKVNERIDSEVDIDGKSAIAFTSGLVMGITVDVGGTEYSIGDEISINGGGGQDAKARVATIADAVVEGIDILDSGDGYSVGDVLKFIDEGTGGQGAAARVSEIITTRQTVINSDQVASFRDTLINAADYESTLKGHNANTHLWANSSVVFRATITNGKYFDSASPFMNTQFLKAGQLLHKRVRIGSELGDNIGLLQTGTTITLDTPLSEAERRDIVGGKLTYANGNTTIITGYTNTTVVSVKDSHSISSSQIYDIDYGSNTVWGTIIGANSTQILYTVGSIYVDPVVPDIASVNNFINGDTVMVYDPARTKAYATKSANSHDSALTHTGITFDLSNTPAVQSVNSSSNVTITNAFGQSGDTVVHLTQGAFTTSTKNTGAIAGCQITAGGEKYEASPVVTVTNGYMSTLGNALDVTGANNSLVNLNLHTYTTGTIIQTGNVVTLSGGTFPDANSGLLKIEYANGNTDFVTSVTNTSSVKVATEKNFGINDAAQTYKLTYMAIANNFVKNSYVYNDDFSARAKVLDFIDKPKSVRPHIADGNTTLRLQMTTSNTFSSTTEYLLMENEDIIAYEDDPADGLFQGSSRVFTETGPTSERLTSYTNTISTVSSGTITQKGFYLQQEGVSDSSGFITENGSDKFITDQDIVVTLASASFPNDVIRGTLVYADSSTTTVSGFSNSTTIEVETSKAIGSGQTYVLNYNGVVTWGDQRTVTAAGSGTGNRTVTVTDTGHNLRTGDKIKFTGALTTTINGTREITVLTTNTYSFTLPENGSATINGELRVRGVASAYLSSYNTYTVDTSPKGNNASVEVSAIAIGAIKTIEVYNFGAGYTSLPTVSTTTGNRNAVLTATLGAFAEYAGYYTGGKGLLSGTPKIQDNKYYQDFSYVLKTDFDVTDYRDSVKRLVHPSGMLMFGEVAFRNKESAAMFDAGRSGDINSTDSNTARTAGGYSPKYRVTIPTINSFANVQHKPTPAVAGGGYQSYLDPNGGIIELQTMKHPWQAMDGKIDVRNDENLLIEDFRNVTMQRTHAEGSIIYATITDTLHNLEVGDEIQITKATQDFWNGRYEVSTVPNSNSYTVVLYRGDPGAGATATAQTATGGGTIKVETLAFANGWRANTSNWEAPFNDALSDELDNERFLLEHGGTFLYPKLSFPTPESGATTIDMSFNSDILLEDLTEDGPAYLLDEASGTVGQGPVRFISLEEDTEGYGHQYLSIPYQETHVQTQLLESMNSGIVTEDGLDDIVLEDNQDLDVILMEDWTQDDPTIMLFEDGTQVHAETAIFRFNERRRIIIDDIRINNGSYYPIMYIDHLTSIGKIRTEDNCMILMENGKDYIRVEHPYYMAETRKTEFEFYLYENAGWNLVLEDGGHLIEEGDETSQRLSRFQTEEDHVKTSVVEVQADLVDQMGWHILMENDDHLIHEDRTRAITEENPNKTSTIEITPTNKLPWTFLGHLLTEDSSQIFCAEDGTRTQLEDEMGGVRDGTAPEFNLNLYENSGYNLFMEDGSHMILEADNLTSNTRISTEESHIKTLNGEVEIIPGRTGGYSDYTKPVRTIVMTTVMGQSRHRFFLDGVQHPNIVFEPGVYYKWDVSDPSNFDNDSGDEHIMAFSTTLNGHHNSGSEYTTDVTRVGMSGQPGAYILMKMPESGNLYYYCAGTAGSDLHKWMAGFDSPAGVEGQGLITPYALSHNFAAIRTSKTERKGPEQMTGHISIPHNGTTATGTNTVFTDELRVGDVFHTGDENILLEDTDLDVEILLETDERLEHEIMRVMHVEDDEMGYVSGVRIDEFKWFICSEDSNLADFAKMKIIEGSAADQGGMQDGIQGGYDLNTTDESFYLLGEDSQAGDILYLEDDSGQLIMETSDALSDDLLLEDGSKILFTEPGEFKISSITDDDTLVVTRKHWGGTDAVPFWKQTTWNFLMENDDLMVFESGSGVPLTEEETSITSSVRYT